MNVAPETNQVPDVMMSQCPGSRLGVFKWTAVGMLLGGLVVPVGTPIWERYLAVAPPEAIFAPAMAMLRFWQSFGLGPHGDAGFILLLVFPVIQWILFGLVAGFLVGAILEWPIKSDGKMAHALYGLRFRKWKALGSIALLGVAAIGLHCVRRESVYAKDREYFLTRVDYRAFAEACLKMVVSPDEYGLAVGNCPRPSTPFMPSLG